MDAKLFTTIAVTGFSVAFFHAAIPTHWLPFVLTSRVQKWSKARTLAITTLAGCGHVLFTAALGFLVAWCGIALNDKIGKWFPLIAGGGLLAFGLYHSVQQLRGHGHGHSHDSHAHNHEVQVNEHGHAPHEHDEHDEHDLATDAGQPPQRKSDWAAIVSLLALLTFSPCEGFLPVYASGVSYGWNGFFLLTLILSIATVSGMVVFTWLTLAGMEKLKLQVLEKYEHGILGGLLCLLGLTVIIFEH